MKIVQLSAGLGNQMFQYAFALSLKQRFNMPVLLDKGIYDAPPHQEHECLSLDIFPIALPYATQEQVTKAKKSRLVRYIFKKCGLPTFAPYCIFDYNPKLMRKKSYSYYMGFFQNPLYFSDLSLALKSAFTPPPLQAQ